MKHTETCSCMSEKDMLYFSKYGADKDIIEHTKELLSKGIPFSRTPVPAYLSQKKGAKDRGIEWKFELKEWWLFWQASGKWYKRGVGRGYVMCRIGDVGPYSAENCFIETGAFNISYYFAHKKGQVHTNDTDNEIVLIRRARDWTQAQLADHLCISQAAVSMLESGRNKASGPVAKALAALLRKPRRKP